MTEMSYINECTGEFQIIPVTMFLVMLFNACWMFQRQRKSNILIFALDTFDLGDTIEHEKFMKTLSESTYLHQIPNWNSLFNEKSWKYNNSSQYCCFFSVWINQMHYRGILLTRDTLDQIPALQKNELNTKIEEEIMTYLHI